MPQPLERRHRLLLAPSDQPARTFAEEVRAGLEHEPRSLPCRFLYDARGSKLFERICELPEYYPTRTETEILRTRAGELAARMSHVEELVELGSGAAEKTRHLLSAFLGQRAEFTYLPIDISHAALEWSARALLERYPALSIVSIAGEYEPALRRLREQDASPRCVAWLGSSIGNLERPQAARFLRTLCGFLEPHDRLLVGIDLRKDPAVLERAYDDRAGVTAAFNRNLLVRIDRELGGTFRPERFVHRAVWNEERGCVQMFLESREDQDVRIEALDLVVRFAAGERIHTENSFKYAPAEIDVLVAGGGLRTCERFTDARGWFSLNLLAPDHR